SLARPGGNVTGTAVQVAELYEKSFQLVRTLAPARTKVAVLSASTTPERINEAVRDAIARAVMAFGMTAQTFGVMRSEEVGDALQRIAGTRAEVLLVLNVGVTESSWREITRFAIQQGILSIGTGPLFPSFGGAMYYGFNSREINDRTASFIDRILRGTKPSDL